MTRVGWLLTGLLAVLLIIGWYFLIFVPTSEDIEDVRAQTQDVRAQTDQQLARAAQLRAVREEAPEAEAQLAFGRSLIPEDAAIPALFRQLQQAADDAGARLGAITASDPVLVEHEEGEYTSIGIAMDLEASYFQIVDMARRVEDPLLTPRAVRWDAITISPLEFPELTVSLSGRVFSRGVPEIPLPPDPTAETADPDAEPDGDSGDDPADDPLDEVES